MENDVQHLIDLLYDMIDNAKGVPLGNDKCIIERNRALDYLDQKGVFKISKTSVLLCETLKVLKYTLYNYLEEARSSRGDKESEE